MDGLHSDVSQGIRSSRVWSAVLENLEESSSVNHKAWKVKKKNDSVKYMRDCRKFSIDHGTNKYIARAREALESMEGGTIYSGLWYLLIPTLVSPLSIL